MRRLAATTVCASLLCAAPLALADRGEVSLRVKSPSPEVRADAEGLARVTAAVAGAFSAPGEPDLPSRIARIALPPDAMISTVEVDVRPLGVRVLPGRHDVRPAPPETSLCGGPPSWGERAHRVVDGRDVDVYGSRAPFPREWGGALGSVSSAGPLLFVTVVLHPVRYHPMSGALEVAGGFDVAVSFETGEIGASGLRAGVLRHSLARRLVDNYEEAIGWYGAKGPEADEPVGVVVITTESLREGESRSELLDAWAEMREQEGYEVTIVTESQWDVPTGELLDDRADRIRAWLRANADTLDLGWALLVGNPDPAANVWHSVPMKYCTDAPTDHYYADISGTWDPGGNGEVCNWGSDDMDVGQGAVDFVPEIYVGRIPAYSDGGAAVDEILERIMAYEEESAYGDVSWRRRMMLPDSIYFFDDQYGEPTYERWDGATVGEWFVRDELRPRGMEWTTLYEREGVSPSNFPSHFPIDMYNVYDQWLRGYGVVFWAGHGSYMGVYRSVWKEDSNEDEIPDHQEMSSPEFASSSGLHMLVSAPPPFVIHGSCSNGYPESPDNLGYNMLRRGAIGTLSASREAATWHYPGADPEMWEKPEVWDGDVIDIVTEYTVNLMDGMPAGQAVGEAIAKTVNAASRSWYQKSIQNYYGDPLVDLVVCRADADCDNGYFCDGEEICERGACLAGEPVVCEPTSWCDDMICDDDLGCVPAESCPPEPPPDAGAGGGGEADGEEVVGALSACASSQPGRGDGGGLLAILGAAMARALDQSR